MAVFLVLAPASPGAAAQPGALAAVEVSGLGLFGDRSLRQSLELLLGSQRGQTMDANAIEDAALLAYSSVSNAGFLAPSIRIVVTDAGGSAASYTFDPQFNHPLPRSLIATTVRYEVRRGRRFTIGAVALTGLTAMRPEDARTYFRADGILAAFTDERAYTPNRVRQSASNLLEELRRRGYAEARVTVGEVSIDPPSGIVTVPIAVHEGPRWRVATLRYAVADGSPAPLGLAGGWIGQPWSSSWQHDAETGLRRWYFQRGYPDVRIRVTPEAAPAAEGFRAVTAVAAISPGALIRLGRVRFIGNTRTKESVLRPLVRVQTGDPLNLLQTQDGLYRLSRLGVFSAAELRYEPPQGSGARDAVYELQEGKKQDVDLLLGWGSFDELRGGVVWHDYDLFERAHASSLKFVQSLKSTEGEYDYTVPELFATAADGTAKLFGFQRHDRAFLDEEYGVNFSVATPVPALGANFLAGYTFERLRAANDTLATALTDLTHANATSVQAGLTRDRRDNPVAPRRGYKLFARVEEASRWLGGQVDFQEVQIGASYHTKWGRSRWLHLGFSHSFLTTFGAPAKNALPPNVLFYPGGEDSIRGYGRGEAAPRGAGGQFLGAQTATLLSVELEQGLTDQWSVVLFSDSLGAAAQVRHFPFDYELYSMGAGVRLRTLVGPVRLEYGRNLNPRPQDPRGTVQFSIGFPF